MSGVHGVMTQEIILLLFRVRRSAQRRSGPTAVNPNAARLNTVDTPSENREARSQMDAAEALPPAGEPADGLTPREHEILAFERQWWKYAGAKERAVRELFDMSPTRYYQVLNALIDSQDAMRADPMLVKRLRRLRASRQRARAARRLGVDPR
jgi:Protein of unknown function (DUF3263)